jgi:hypothetical protein
MTASNPALLRHWEYTGYVTVSRELRPVPLAPNLTGLSPALRPLVDAAKPRSRSRSRPRKTSSCSRRRLRASTSAQRASATPAGRRSPPAAGQCSPSDLVRPCWPPLDYLSPPLTLSGTPVVAPVRLINEVSTPPSNQDKTEADPFTRCPCAGHRPSEAAMSLCFVLSGPSKACLGAGSLTSPTAENKRTRVMPRLLVFRVSEDERVLRLPCRRRVFHHLRAASHCSSFTGPHKTEGDEGFTASGRPLSLSLPPSSQQTALASLSSKCPHSSHHSQGPRAPSPPPPACSPGRSGTCGSPCTSPLKHLCVPTRRCP